MVNQASLTGESVPVRRTLGSVVYAGTVLEEGELTILVKQTGGSSRYEKITAMIEESEKLKSDWRAKAEHLADRLVPYSLWWNGVDVSSDQKCNESTLYSDGGLLLCVKTCHADFRSLCNPRGKPAQDHRKGR